ncbi:MAG TPA: HAD family phosphatase [Phycisphaerales bacterium]|nr:HAD family phosphatase [Phycisphaerales bacterium]
MVRAVIFDFDGVLVHSEPAHLLATRATLAHLGVTFTDEEYYESYVAFADRRLLSQLPMDKGRPLSDEELEAVLSRKRVLFTEHLRAGRVRAFPGSLELVRACKERVPVALCTAAEHGTVDAVLAHMGIAGLFETVVAAEDVPVSKPDPAPYALAAKRLGIPPADCVAVEDTVGGATSALRAGCRVVAVGHTLPRERLALAHAFFATSLDVTVDDLLAA